MAGNGIESGVPRVEILTPRDIARSDRDIRTFEKLQQALEIDFAVAGGYASDIHLVGRITRAHADADVMVSYPAGDPQYARRYIGRALDEDFDSSWELSEMDVETGLNFRDTSAEPPRELEISLTQYDLMPQRKTIYDSEGKPHTLNVLPVSSLVALKIIFLKYWNQLGWRIARDTELPETRKLANHPEFRPYNALEEMVRYFREIFGMNDGEARKLALNDWNKMFPDLFPDQK